MKPKLDNHWAPSPQLLAAYADGELQGTPALDALHMRIENWLAEHPCEAAELEFQRELARLMAVSRPPEPGSAVWTNVWARALSSRPVAINRRIAEWLVGTAAAALVFIIVGSGTLGPGRTNSSMSVERQKADSLRQHTSLPPKEVATDVLEVLELVRAEDIEIIHVAGPDAAALLIGRAPFAEIMTLLQIDEMAFSSSSGAEPKTELRTCGNRTPLVWTPLPKECKGGQ